jgi:hypothetical protein
MKKTLLLLFVVAVSDCYSQQQPGTISIERWKRFELTLQGPSTGNPFTSTTFSATFKHPDTTFTVTGFYDGNGMYKVRFMPDRPGTFTYTTKSNNKSLHAKTGRFTCMPASANNHGPVKVAGTYNFQYADGKPFYPFGTTLYAWTHMGAGLQQLTIQTLSKAPFNKVRMCVFPKHYSYVQEEPPFYPYVKRETTHNSPLTTHTSWDFTQFNPAFFQHLEEAVSFLDQLGIEADIIIFHPYDKGHWGFDNMGRENDLRYIQYLVARLGAFKNVWWSLANEFDFIKTKPRQVWSDYIGAVTAHDPYKHLCSIHNGSVYYDNSDHRLTHASIQNGSATEDFGRAVLLRDVYFKPVIYDEVCYEGNLPLRWGRLSGQEMTEAFWQGMIAGTYVTHGETYTNKGDTIFWSKGGALRGTSVARIAFLRKLMEEGPGALHLADPWKDHKTAQFDSTYYLVYFGKQMPSEWVFNIPVKNGPAAGARFKAEIIDTWDMTITPVADTFQLSAPNDYRLYDSALKKIRLPAKPYLALRLIKL